jgi:hypothetical protein
MRVLRHLSGSLPVGCSVVVRDRQAERPNLGRRDLRRRNRSRICVVQRKSAVTPLSLRSLFINSFLTPSSCKVPELHRIRPEHSADECAE